MDVIKYISQCFEKIRGPRLEYQQTIPDSQKDVIITRNVKKYADSNLPMILILSEEFLSTVWPTASKPTILGSILNYANKLSVHVWCSSVTAESIKRYSTMLLKELPNFRTATYDKLQFMTHEEVGLQLVKLLKSK